MEYKCDTCGKNFKTQESLQQHNSMKHSDNDGKKSKINWRKYFILGMVGLIIIFSVLSISAYMKKPGEYDDFAKCLTEKGAVVYGNDFCQYTVKQLNFFGKSQKYLNYIRCSENKQLCDEKNIQVTPTWEIDGEMYKQVQDFEKLAAISKCEI